MSCPKKILQNLDGGLVDAGQSWHLARHEAKQP